MVLSDLTIEQLKHIITGDSKITEYLSGPKLVKLFNQYSSYEDTYGEGFPSRHIYAEEKLKELNGSKSISDLILNISDSRRYRSQEQHEEVIEAINRLIKPDGFILSGGKVMPYTNNGESTSQTEKVSEESALNRVEKICKHFHLFVSQLQRRYSQRDTISVDDEYDVQDLMHALLRIDFSDIRAEEYTPSYAGSSSRVDFLLKEEQIVIEIKKTRRGLTSKEVGNQLIIDIDRYRSHPDCKQLICFVYDPEGWIQNPSGLERDLAREEGGIEVIAIIAPKGT